MLQSKQNDSGKTDGQMNLVTSSLLELLIAAKNPELESKLVEAYKRIEEQEIDREEVFKTHDNDMLKVQNALKVAN